MDHHLRAGGRKPDGGLGDALALLGRLLESFAGLAADVDAVGARRVDMREKAFEAGRGEDEVVVERCDHRREDAVQSRFRCHGNSV